LLGISIDYGYILNPLEELEEADLIDGDVFYLPNETALTIKSPAGWTFTTQLFGTTNGPSEPIQIATDGVNFASFSSHLAPGIAGFINSLYPDNDAGGIYAKWVAQHVQLWYNAETALGNVAMDITDATYRVGSYSSKNNPFPFFAVSDSDGIAFNGTEGKSGFRLPQRDEILCSEMPFFAGGLPGVVQNSTVFSMSLVAIDRGNVVVHANTDGAVTGVITWSTCDGHTDIADCPFASIIDLGAEAQPVEALPVVNP